MSLQSAFRRLKTFFLSKGSVFVKIAEADALVLEAKGRIIAVDAANAAKNYLAATFEKEVERVHADSEAVKQRFNDVLSNL
jgi:hypothetical protein